MAMHHAVIVASILSGAFAHSSLRTAGRKSFQPSSEFDTALYSDDSGMVGDADIEAGADPYAKIVVDRSADSASEDLYAEESGNALLASQRHEKLGDQDGEGYSESETPSDMGSDAAFDDGVADGQTPVQAAERPYEDAPHNGFFTSQSQEQSGHQDGESDPESDAALLGHGFIQLSSVKGHRTYQPGPESDAALYSGGHGMAGDADMESDAALYAGGGSDPAADQADESFDEDGSDKAQRGPEEGEADSESDSFIQVQTARGDEILDGPVASVLEVPEVFPVPAASRCIVIICIQYMLIYFLLAVCRTYHDVSGSAKGKLEAGLRAAGQTVTYGPMLCVLFIACRMRVEYLSDGKDQPPMWVQHCMFFVTFSVLFSTILVLVIPVLTGYPLPVKEGTCDLEKPSFEDSDSKFVFYALTAARYLILLGLYGGLAGILVGMCLYMPPGVTDLSKVPAPAPAVMCTMILAVVFFVIQLVIAMCRTYEEFMGHSFPKVVGVMDGAAVTVEFYPMLCILFLAARMRALQHQGQPQEWAQSCMYIATGAMCVTTLLAIVVPVVLGGTMTINDTTGEATFEVPDPMAGYCLVFVRYLCMSGFYLCAAAIVYSIFAFEAPAGPQATLPVSPTVQCVVNLTCQFLFVYAMMTAMLTVSELSGQKELTGQKKKLFTAIESSKTTLSFAPMLSILFVTTRMYALLLTDNKGAPAAWVQDGMYMATWALLISFVSCLFTGFFMDKVKTDEDGNVVNKFTNNYVAIAMSTLRYFTMLLLYGGMITVIVGLFVMTPETANGRGSIPLVSDAVNSTPIGNAPPGPNTVADGASQVAHTAGSAVA